MVLGLLNGIFIFKRDVMRRKIFTETACTHLNVRPMLEFSCKVETTMAVLRPHQFSVIYALDRQIVSDHPLR